MAYERAPQYAFLNRDMVKSYRPPQEKVATWHKVVSGRTENLATVAARYQVPFATLIEFNFPGSVNGGRVVPEIVNWYLWNHNGFHCPETRDRKNRIFRGGEWIAIPHLGCVTLGEPLVLKRKPPVSLDDPATSNIFADQKFTFDWKISNEPRDLGYLMAQLRIAGEGQLVREGLIKMAYKPSTRLSKMQIKASVEHKFTKRLKGTLAFKVDKKTLDLMADEVRKGSATGFARALVAPFEASLKTSVEFGKFAIAPEILLELAPPPPLVMAVGRVSGEYHDTLEIGGLQLDCKFIVKLGLATGLSAKGWAWLAEKVGAEALKRFALSAGRTLTGLWESLVAEGIVAGAAVIAGAVVGAFAMTYLMAWILADASRKGVLQGMATWYVEGYTWRLFGRPRAAEGSVGRELDAAKNDLIRLGERDAIADARSVMKQAGRPEANGTDEEVLRAYREVLIALHGSAPEQQVRRTLEERSRKLAGG